MQLVGTGLGSDVDVGSSGGALRGIVHGGVDALLGDGLLRRRRERLTDGVKD